MRRFISRVIFFLTPFAVLFSLSLLSNPESGDLARMAGLQKAPYHHQPDHEDVPIQILNGHKDSSLVIIGDSFLNRSERSRNLQRHISNDLKIIPFCSRLFDESNPFRLLQHTSDSLLKIGSIAPSLVILESVERATAGRLKTLNQTAGVQNNLVQPVQSWSSKTAIKKGITLVITRVLSFIGSHKTGSSQVYQLKIQDGWQGIGIPSWIPVFAGDALYNTNSIDQEELKPHFDTLLEIAKDFFPEAEIKFLIIPDKSSVLTKFYDTPRRNEAINWENLHPNILYPIRPLQTAIEQGIPDVYRWGDTHLGNNGSKIVGEYINSKSTVLSERFLQESNHNIE